MRKMMNIVLAAVLWLVGAGTLCAQDKDKERTFTAQDSLNYCMKQAQKALLAQRPEAAYRWYRRAVRYDSPSACLALGNCYYFGYGTPCDYDKAYRWFYKAAERGNTVAEYSIGRCYFYGRGTHRDGKQAAAWYRLAAEKGYGMANFGLGCCYKDGDGVPVNYPKAVELFEKAAADSLAAAYYMLGSIYESEREGWTPDARKAFDNFRKAADMDYAKAQYKLGNYYEIGRGCTRDYAQAKEWYRKAAENGDMDAQYRLGRCYYYGLLDTKPDYGMSFHWLSQAAAQSHERAQYHLGVLYQNGEGVKQDDSLAYFWFRRAAALCAGYLPLGTLLPGRTRSDCQRDERYRVFPCCSPAGQFVGKGRAALIGAGLTRTHTKTIPREGCMRCASFMGNRRMGGVALSSPRKMPAGTCSRSSIPNSRRQSCL